MPLSLVVGPAHAGKVALLLERYLAALGDDPWLVVPNRADVERVERDLLTRRAGLLGGRIGTFDDLFEHLASEREDGAFSRVLASDTQRLLALRRAIGRTELDGLAASAGSNGFADALAGALGEIEAALVDPGRLEGDLGRLATAYRAELDRLGLEDRHGLRRRAVERLSSELDAWHGEPVFAYGFEDLTGAEWALVEGLAGRADVIVSIPYEPGRAAFSALERTVGDLSALAAGRIEELRPSDSRGAPDALAHVERQLFLDEPDPGPALDGALRFLEGAGARGTAELVAAAILDLVRAGTAADRIAVVCDSVDRYRATFDTVFDSLGIPYAIEQHARLGDTPFGRAALGIMRFAWLDGRRGELFRYLRSPYSGLERRTVDFVEGRLRGRAIAEPTRVVSEAERFRGAGLPALEALRAASEPVAAARELVRTMARNAWGLETPPTSRSSRSDLRAYQAALRTLDELVAFGERDGSLLGTDDVVQALERTSVRPVGAGEPGYVAILDYERARTRSFDTVFLLGLDEGSFPRRERPSPFVGDDVRAALGAGLGARLERVDSIAYDRYLLYTACTRATRRVVCVREAANDEGVPREPSPFWDDIRSLFDSGDVARATERRPLSRLTWGLDSAPSERERLRALARLAVDDEGSASALAAANGWSRRLERARSAFDRRTALESPGVLGWLGGRSMFAATELERFADCSSAWLVERVVDPKTIDAEPDALLRGQIVHTALNRFYSSLPKELASDRVTPGNLDAALALVRRCLDDAVESGARLDLTPLQAAELRQTLLADLEGFVRDESTSEFAFDPRRFEVAFGSDRAAPELQRGLALGDGLWLSGKIDRIDIDPFSARGIVQDYKSGAGAHSARDIDRELRLQIPLYVLVLRDLVGVEPLGGVYRSLSGRRVTRGMLRESAREDLPGFARHDYLDEDEFWAQTETARERAADYANRIRAGDVRHDPKGDGCPSWCDLWTICRVPRS
jgi:ATP-dependent helicase/DNAse subunit B